LSIGSFDFTGQIDINGSHDNVVYNHSGFGYEDFIACIGEFDEMFALLFELDASFASIELYRLF